jgi:GTP-binding protein EngB required for normal cell division
MLAVEKDSPQSTEVSIINETLSTLGLKQVRRAVILLLRLENEFILFDPGVNFYSQITGARNVVIFGNSGVGKSSLINMLAGHKMAETSDGLLGCTFESRKYTITINEEKVNVWDTPGLDEGTRGRVSPRMAKQNLTKLLRELRSENGIHLLVYCFRGQSAPQSLARNYVFFCSALYRKEVPIVAVVTGLEQEPYSMNDWWTRCGEQLAKYNMHFDDHACVTTIDMDELRGSVFEDRSTESQLLVRKLIINNCHRLPTQLLSDNVFIKAIHDFWSAEPISRDLPHPHPHPHLPLPPPLHPSSQTSPSNAPMDNDTTSIRKRSLWTFLFLGCTSRRSLPEEQR